MQTFVWSFKKNPHFSAKKKKTRLIFFFSLSIIKLCHSDHSLIGLLFLKMEVQQLKVAVSAAEKSFCDVICLGSVPSLRRRSRERQCLGWHCLYSNICSILCGRIRPSGIAVFLSWRKKLSEKNFKENGSARWRAQSSYCLGFRLAL